MEKQINWTVSAKTERGQNLIGNYPTKRAAAQAATALRLPKTHIGRFGNHYVISAS